jgi:hypothetical protein
VQSIGRTAEVQRFGEDHDGPKIIERKLHNHRLSNNGTCFIGQHEGMCGTLYVGVSAECLP